MADEDDWTTDDILDVTFGSIAVALSLLILVVIVGVWQYLRKEHKEWLAKKGMFKTQPPHHTVQDIAGDIGAANIGDGEMTSFVSPYGRVPEKEMTVDQMIAGAATEGS